MEETSSVLKPAGKTGQHENNAWHLSLEGVSQIDTLLCHRGRSSDFQARQPQMAVSYLLPLPSRFGPVRSMERSFLITAAGQFRFFTGFPFKHLVQAYRSALESVS